MTDTTTPPSTGRITRLELIVGGLVAAVMLVLVVLEPDILEAPFENGRTILFTLGGTVLAAAALFVMLRFRVPPVVRAIVLLAPFVAVNWWLLSPYFVDDVVDEAFAVSIADQLSADDPAPADEAPADPVGTAAPADPVDTAAPADPVGTAAPADGAPVTDDEPPSDTTEPEIEPPPAGPVLLGAGSFVGLAGHSGTGDAGIFENPDGSLVLRFENFDIENGPDLEVYLVPGADQTALADGNLHLGALKGNIGDQTYALEPGAELPAGTYTALVWCEAFSVEFVGATITI